MTSIFYDILSQQNYITNNQELTIKGICASNINECNGMLLTEIIFSNMLDKLTTQEIIALMSIFLNPPRTGDDYNYNSYNLRKEYKQIQEIVNKFKSQEEKINIFLDYWNIDDSYIDIVMMWVQNKPMQDIMTFLYQDMGEYEGTFVRNMLKLNNIITNLTNVAQIINNISLVDKLKTASELILKDIVNVNSLYLS